MNTTRVTNTMKGYGRSIKTRKTSLNKFDTESFKGVLRDFNYDDEYQYQEWLESLSEQIYTP